MAVAYAEHHLKCKNLDSERQIIQTFVLISKLFDLFRVCFGDPLSMVQSNGCFQHVDDGVHRALA